MLVCSGGIKTETSLSAEFKSDWKKPLEILYIRDLPAYLWMTLGNSFITKKRDKDMDNHAFEKENGDTNTVEVPMNHVKPTNGDLKGCMVVGTESQYPPEEPLGSRASSYQLTVDNPDPDPPPAGHDNNDDDEEDDEDYGLLTMLPYYHIFKEKVDKASKSWKERQMGRRVLITVLALLYTVYFISVLAVHTEIEKGDYWCEGDGFLILITIVGIIGLSYFQIIKPMWGPYLHQHLIKPIDVIFANIWSHRLVRWLFCLVLLLSVVVFLGLDTRDDPRRLVSVFGVIVLLLFGFIFSKAPRKVRWRHVAWGMGLQFMLGLIILRWPMGKAVFQCAGVKVSAFLAFTDAGSSFVFGKLVSEDELFAFKVLSVILFFSFCIQILYYLGVMQWVVIKLGWCLQVTVGTTACESVNASANIFLGQSEAPLLIKPYIILMTKSELHAVMTGGFATIAGTVLAAYINFGIDSSHLLSASVMSAPAALAFAKLFYPETKRSRTGADEIKIVKGDEANLLHAALSGVTTAIPLVANITANLIAFYAFITFCNAVFNWTCILAGAQEGVCSLENLFGWIFMPLAWLMGVDWSECDKVGELIGLKTIINEFVAYAKLRDFKKIGAISKRAEIIATYALCGFSNICAIGINLGAIGSMAPSRRGDIARVAWRAMIAGSCACFLTACIAGTLLDDFPDAGTTSTANTTDLTP
ncbi:hypothetical protein Pmani_023585 [Petrolisthes manimaculis]|uniref:Sodium/nucleoside cotransporter n=1 Tax=Petrolisthes manimaculis TaxID=1843537 RepID=A0AAE1PC38_9EUCA|nr:hypothetical protein Pmani_023585 [Petrolisthes manimaculis]